MPTTQTRGWKWPQGELKGYRVYLQVGGFQRYENLFAGGDCPLIEVGRMISAKP